MDITWDRETTGLLNEESIDYTASPYKLKPSFKTHCHVVQEHQTGKIIAFYDGDKYELDGREYAEVIDGRTYFLNDYSPVKYEHRTLAEFKDYIEENDIDKVVGHNIINYDLLVGELEDGMLYEIDEDTWCNKVVDFRDTLVISKTQNPDRLGGHSLEALAEKTGSKKIDFRKDIPVSERFKHFAADMLYYNIRDVLANTAVHDWLLEEAGNWPWEEAIKLEKYVAWIITRQEHRGFKFNKELAENNIEELDLLMEERRVRAEPVIPPKPATQAFLKTVTPPARQFLKSTGSFSADMIRFVERLGGELIEGDIKSVKLYGKVYELPMAREPLITHVPATLNDSTHIKNWLVGLGWVPSEYKDKDLSVKTGKIKRTREEFEEAVEKYVEQTLNSNFLDDRCDHLETSPKRLRDKLLGTKEGKNCKVATNPNFTKGQEKEICPNLLALSKQFPYARDVVDYLTYKHRRNSILGGGLEWDEEEEAEKGYLAYVREDGRIPTPADTCGAATSRFKHKVVANIPRITSLYGENMRGLFGVDDGYYQIGYDFDSLEAKMESSYCWKYEDDAKEYCNSLTLEKPNDVHSVLARKITDLIGRIFNRTPAKSTKYAATYGATEKKIAKTIGESLAIGTQVYNAFWEAALPLKLLKEALKKYWENTGGKRFILGIDKRKVPTRSAHAILNSLFQSAGVICAKRAMVIHDKLLREKGLLVNFFRDDWKNSSFCQQLIAYHDEAQLEVSKDLVKFKMVRIPDLTGKDEDEVKDIHKAIKAEAQTLRETMQKETGKLWSEVAHTDKAYYTAYCEAGELATIAVDLAGKYYNLNVPLTAGYIIHKSWAGCH